jgi:enoyl-[acyl-carrier-protein] reductase (NADH)
MPPKMTRAQSKPVDLGQPDFIDRRAPAISPGPLATPAAFGIPEFDELLAKAQAIEGGYHIID